MSYIGNKPATSFETVQKQISTSNSGTTITLDRAVTSVQDILLTIDAVVQSYDNYSVSGTTLTVGGTLNNNRVEILYVGRTMQSVDPTDDSVSASKIKTDAVTTAKIQNDAVTKDKVNFATDSTSAGITSLGDGTSSGNSGAIELRCSNNNHGVQLISPDHSASQSWKLKLPDNSPTADKFLKVKSITGSGSTATGQLEFADAGGTHVLVGSVNLSGGSTQYADITSCFSTTYNVYKVQIRRFIPISDDNGLKLRYFNTSDNVADGNNYRWLRRRFRTGAEDRYNAHPDNNIELINGVQNSDTTGGGNLELTIRTDRNTSGGNSFNIFWEGNVARNNNEASFFLGGGYYNDTTSNSAPKGLRFYATSGNISQLKCVVYGLTGAL